VHSLLSYHLPLFLFNWEGGNISEYADLGNGWQEIMRNDKNNVIPKTVQPEFSLDWGFVTKGQVVLYKIFTEFITREWQPWNY